MNDNDRNGVGARTHAVVRQVNDRIRGVAAETESDALACFCECTDPLCTEELHLTRDEYDAARSHPSLVIVRPGHAVSGVTSVVAETSRFRLVETLGATARTLRDAD
jgi:hypothetical protein